MTTSRWDVSFSTDDETAHEWISKLKDAVEREDGYVVDEWCTDELQVITVECSERVKEVLENMDGNFMIQEVVD